MDGMIVTGSEKMLARKADGIGWVTFNNPERHNAVSMEMWEALERIMADFTADPEVRVVVLTGAGGRAFVSGADISKFESERSGEAAVAAYQAQTARAYDSVSDCPKPTIAMIQGHCIGGGTALAVCCDMRICGETASFGVPAAKLGLGYPLHGLRKLVDLVGPSFAKEIFFTAKKWSSEDARVMGLVNRVVPNDQLEAFVTDYAKTIAGNAPLTVGSAKFIIGQALKNRGEADEATCDAMVKACFASEDYVEGRRAFMEKRPPQFKGR
ncbi:enoyl-CoA hydratase [Falsiroseomonas selenitidurans]|uniref:enoyl-CoA hydratase n=1 Tax=Falsiroseomonas selenitidurans TaxID=2716335 RepID=UPI001ADE90B0|nr:enoyl-CoA hydratase [Falsiroseomonas selenitidurans]